MLDSYLSVEAFSGLQEQLNRFDIDDEVDAASDERDGVCFAWSMSRGRFRRTTRWRRSRWPRWTCSTTRTRSLGASVVKSWTRWAKPSCPPCRRFGRSAGNDRTTCRKTARATNGRGPRARVEGDPNLRMTRAAAAHIVGVLWASGNQGVSVKELRAAIGLSRERLEAAYEFLLEQPPQGLAVRSSSAARQVLILRKCM